MSNDDQYASGTTASLGNSFSQSESQHATMDPATPSTPGFSQDVAREPKKRANPLTDLVETEKAFVDQLTGIIRKVAAAWSRSNLPPPELDTMFRSIEAIYKANRGLHAKLKDISADPKSAGELGGLLINWIDDLKKPYENYCNKYCTGFDEWTPVQSNARLGPVLSQFSASHPAPSNDGTWTLDSLFILPRTRLGYYLKLYKRLLKNTQNPLLVSAVETLNVLIDSFEVRGSTRVGGGSPGGSNAPLDSLDEVVIDMRKQTLSPQTPVDKMLPPEIQGKTGSETSSYASSSTGQRSSRESETTSNSRASTQTMTMPIADLERRLTVDRCLDIFTMNPKPVKLQMNPPSLTFTREMRTSLDVVIRFTPRATGVEVIHREGHIFLLSDLFLICERMSPEERLRPGYEGADMWLCYPPLSGKVLRVSEINGQPNALQVAIMRKEFITIETITREGRDSLISHFKDCVEFSTSLPPPSKSPPPPVPQLNTMTRLQTDSAVSSPTYQGRSPSMSPPSTMRSVSPTPSNPTRISSELPPFSHFNDKILPPEPPMNIHGNLPPPPMPGNQGGFPPPPNALRPSASAQPLSHGPPLHQGPNIPPARSMGYMPGPGNHDLPPPPPQNFAPPNAPYAGPSFASNSNPNLSSPYPGQPPMRPPLGQYPPNGPPGAYVPPRPPSEPSMGPGFRGPPGPGGPPPHGQFAPPPNFGMAQIPRNNSFAGMGAPGPGGMQPPGGLRPMLPSQAQRAVSSADPAFASTEPSPPNSPEQRPQDLGPVTSTISAQMKCKVFLQQQHAQWKSLGAAKLKLYRQEPTNIKQLVVEADNKNKSILISTIVLTDGVERVGKTGVAVELSDKGSRTGIIYMLQLRTEEAAGGLFDGLIAGSDRAR